MIKKGLIDLFPNDIDTLYDLFGGSSVVSINTKANRYIINDIDINIYKFYKIFSENEYESIINKIIYNIDMFNLPRFSVKTKGKEEKDKYKKRYLELRDYSNKTNDVIDLYTCMFYAFSQQIRFNKYGIFNMPRGNDAFTKNNEQYIKNMCKFIKNNKVEFYNNDYHFININDITKNSFVYLDPPYINTTATYNENNGWSIEDDIMLFEFCETLNKNGIKFGLSNVFKNKGIINKHLMDWCIKNNWNVYYFDGFKYYACGNVATNTIEVYISNYIPNK